MLKKSLKNQISLVLSIFFVVFIGMSNVQAANDSSNPFPKPICRIEIDNAHISKSMFKRQIGKWVKINARSICNVYQQRVTLSINFYKVGEFGDHFIGHTFSTNEFSATSSGLIVEIKNAAVHCKDDRPTQYYGIAYAKAFINGKWQYAGNTRSPIIEKLLCGT